MIAAQKKSDHLSRAAAPDQCFSVQRMVQSAVKTTSPPGSPVLFEILCPDLHIAMVTVRVD